MGGVGLLTALAVLLLLPFELWAVSRANWLRLTPAEQSLRLATHPPAIIAVLLVAAAGAGAHDIGGMLLHLVGRSSREVQAVGSSFCALLIGYWLICVWQCIGMRDPRITARAFLKLAVGAAVTVYLGRLYPWSALAPSLWAFSAVAAVFLVGVWFLTTGAFRFLLLIVPLRSARRIVGMDIAGQKFDWNR